MYVHEQLNNATMVVLQVLFHYEIIYEMGPPILEKQVKESQSRVTPPSSAYAVTPPTRHPKWVSSEGVTLLTKTL